MTENPAAAAREIALFSLDHVIDQVPEFSGPPKVQLLQ
jgi:hypothetical protein